MTRTNNTATNPYKVGDIVFIRWGYDMILIQYYKVTRVTPSKVGLVELEQDEQYTGYLSGKTTPIEDKEIEGSNAPYSAHKDCLYKVCEDGRIRIPSYRGGHDYKNAEKWHGTPLTFDHCD